MSQTHYQVLGVLHTASKFEIKNAYRKLALQYHPDKCTDKDSNEKYLKIKEAYEILSDDFKRNIYDSGISENGNMAVNWNDFINYMIVTMVNIYNKWKENRQNAIIIDIDVPLRDIYSKKVKKLKVLVKRLNDKKEIEDTIVTLYIHLSGGQTEHLFQNMGDENHLGFKTDIIVKIKLIEGEHGIYVDKILSKNDLYIEKELSLYEYYYIKEFSLPYFNNDILLVSYETGKRVTLLKGYGLPYFDDHDEEEKRGDLFIHFSVKLPESVPDSDDIKSVIHNYFPIQN